MLRILGLAFLLVLVRGDVYLSGTIQGSNNRQAENSANRANANRLFDSQNNNRGGVNVGCRTNDNCAAQEPLTQSQNVDPSVGTNAQYVPTMFEGSLATIEWTAQHACGGNEAADPAKTNCNIVLQYACDSDAVKYAGDQAMKMDLRVGTNTNTPNTANTRAGAAAQDQANKDAGNGGHESSAYYYECSKRERNKGLFSADQNVNGNTAIYTRQNPNAGRSGLECAEERDYYPYWAPSPWVDVAILTDTYSTATCAKLVAESQNVKSVYKCTAANPNAATDAQLQPITQAACTAANGVWTEYKPKGVAAPVCAPAPWSRDNHLGNGRDGYPNGFNWTLPTVADLEKAGMALNAAVPGTATKPGVGKWTNCVFRLRYNISTDDYDPAATTATSNKANGRASPVVNNPTVDVGAGFTGLKLAINTNQFGRTFQDRSHVFRVESKPDAVKGKIINLTVRGQRGNIVQRYPSIEYDWVPAHPEINAGDTLAIQWHGSNTANNGNPAGDGQAGDAGEGTGGTDRSNFVTMPDINAAYPSPLDTVADNIFAKSDCWTRDVGVKAPLDCALHLATSGYYRNAAEVATKAAMSVTLDNAPASLVGSVLLTPKAASFKTSSTYNIASTRNNNFSNRSQKTTLTINPNPK